MTEYNFIPKSRKYLHNFVHAKLSVYREALIEYHPQKGYGYYKNNSAILDCLNSIKGHFEDKYSNTSIPENFTTVNELIEDAERFSKWLKTLSDKIFEEALNSYPDDEIPSPIIEINHYRNDTINAFTEFVRLAKIEVKEIEHPSIDENLEGIDIRKFKPKAIWNFLKNCTWYSHLLIWGLIVSLGSGIAWVIIFFNKDSKQEQNTELNNSYLSAKTSLEQTQKALDIANFKLDSLLNKPIISTTDTVFIERTDNKLNEAKTENQPKGLYNNSKINISEGDAFNDKQIGVSITLTNITLEYKATAVYDIPEIFGTTTKNEIKVTAGKFWKFKKGNKNYKLVISKINPIQKTYGIELSELLNTN